MLLKGLSEPEDFLIDVSPGTYAITAAMQDAGPQTRVVHVNAGESMRLTFNLWLQVYYPQGLMFSNTVNDLGI